MIRTYLSSHPMRQTYADEYYGVSYTDDAVLLECGNAEETVRLLLTAGETEQLTQRLSAALGRVRKGRTAQDGAGRAWERTLDGTFIPSTLGEGLPRRLTREEAYALVHLPLGATLVLGAHGVIVSRTWGLHFQSDGDSCVRWCTKEFLQHLLTL